MSRCIACDLILVFSDYPSRWETVQEDGLCTLCRNIALYPEFHYPKTFQFEELTEEFRLSSITDSREVEY